MKPTPHPRELFLLALEKKVKQKSKQIKKSQKIIYTDALDQYCQILGFKNYYYLKKTISLLKSFEHSNSEGNKIRDRCAYLEMINNNFGYYIFAADLNLYDIENNDPILVTRAIKTLRSSWVDWADKEKQTELRVASKIKAESVVHMHRKLYNETLYVINCDLALSLWLFSWGGTAVIREDLVRDNDYLSRWLSPYKNIPGWE